MEGSVRFSFTVEEINEWCEKALAHYEASNHDFIKTASSKTKDEYFKELIDDCDLDTTIECIEFLQYVHPDKEIRDASVEVSKKMSEFGTKWAYSIPLFEAYKALYENIKDKCNEEEHRYLERSMQSFQRRGLTLPEETRKELQSIDDELSKLSISYSKNLTEVDDHLWLSKEQLDGVDVEFLSTLETNEDGCYKITTKYDHINEIMPYCHVEETRKCVSSLFANRGKEPFQNHTLLQKSIALRTKKASLLGYDSYAAFKLAFKRMADTTDKVYDFLTEMKERVSEKAKEDAATLCEYAGKDAMESWSLSYVSNKYKKEKLALDQKKVQEFFPLQSVLPALFGTFEEIFHITIREYTPTEVQVWHKDAMCYQVSDEHTGSAIGFFYVDLYPREGKYGHAAAFTLKNAYFAPNKGVDENEDIRSLPVSAMVCNFTRATANRPSLLTFREVETFFHELGHIFHQLLSINQLPAFSGTSVERDFVECPSQALENWCYEPEFLTRITKHYETGETMTDEMMGKIKKNKHAFQGLHYVRQLIFATYDMSLHRGEEKDVVDEFNKIQTSLSPLLHQPGCMAANFGHLMGGYEAGYYGYMWSEVYAQEVYHMFKQSGDIFNRSVGLRYRKAILERGGTVDAIDMMRELLGREPSADAFFQDF